MDVSDKLIHIALLKVHRRVNHVAEIISGAFHPPNHGQVEAARLCNQRSGRLLLLGVLGEAGRPTDYQTVYWCILQDAEHRRVVPACQGLLDLRGKTFAIWGLAFKPKTDDMREAPSRVILEALINAGAAVRAFDPEAMAEAKRIYGDKPGFTLVETAEDALHGANALIVVTEWKNFWSEFTKIIRIQ